MSDLASWLDKWDLGQLADKLAEQDIDLDALRQLTLDDIKELGLSVGLRRRLITAMAAGLPAAAVASAVSANPSPLAADQGSGRRQLTVIFSDIVGSSALSRQLDPEEMSTVLRAYRACCTTAVERFGGRISQYLGDGILAYFGYPEAHEDDAERAVRVALAMVREIPQLRPLRDVVLNVRVGIATGLVVVGELIGHGESLDCPVIGETPNLAARLQSEAPPNGIIIAASTHQLTDGLFDCVKLGRINVKGWAEPVPVWQVRGEGASESRFDALRAPGMVPMVSREQELELLRDRWNRAVDGEGQVAVISGEAGVGKSRLIRALRETLNPESCRIFAYYCSPHHQTSALYPIISYYERAAGIVYDEPHDLKLKKLEQLLLQTGVDLPSAVPPLAALLSIQIGERYPPLVLTPQQLKEQTLLIMIHHLETLSRERPVLCLFEDIHWIDPTSLDLLKRVSITINTLPIFLVVTARPPLDEIHLPEQAPTTRLSLTRLTRRHATILVQHRAAGRPIPPEVVELIVARADGVPLFIEELTKSVLEAGLLSTGLERSGTRRPLPASVVPATLSDSLMARLDRMSLAKPVAQLAAVLGRVFTQELLSAVAPPHLQPVEGALSALMAAEIIYPTHQRAQAAYQFKHALLQDVAYQSLLNTTRQHYHERIAVTLERQFPETAEMQPEVVAHHFTEAGKPEPAVGYWLRAGKRATQRSANPEAIAQLERGLALLGAIDDVGERARLEYRLRLALLTPQAAAKGYSSPEIEGTISRALSLSEEIGDTEEIFPALYSRQAFELNTGQIDRAFIHAEETMRLAERNPESETGAFASRSLGATQMFRGDTASARPRFEHTLKIYHPERHRNSALVFGQDQFAVGAAYLSLTLWHLGYVDQAREYSRLAIAHARTVDHGNTLGAVLTFSGGFFAGLCRDGPVLQAFTTELLELTGKHLLPVWKTAATGLMGQALIESGRISDGISQLRAGIAALAEMHVALFRPLYICWLASAFAKCGKFEEGVAALDQGCEVTKGGEHWMDAELHRIRGELLQTRPCSETAAAENCFLAALSVAQQQQSRTLELRAKTSLARLWLHQERKDEARELLIPIVGWFTEGRNTADMREAEAVLAGVADAGEGFALERHRAEA
jgi:class 3 adenylate cyclase/predicted ATPase